MVSHPNVPYEQSPVRAARIRPSFLIKPGFPRTTGRFDKYYTQMGKRYNAKNDRDDICQRSWPTCRRSWPAQYSCQVPFDQVAAPALPQVDILPHRIHIRASLSRRSSANSDKNYSRWVMTCAETIATTSTKMLHACRRSWPATIPANVPFDQIAQSPVRAFESRLFGR